MTTIITGAGGILAYHRANPAPERPKAFGLKGDFHNAIECAFAGLPAFAANSNHAPSGVDLPYCWDAGIDLLFRIAGAR